MIAQDRRRFSYSRYRWMPERSSARAAVRLLVLLVAITTVGCGILGRSDHLRMQKQREAADRYPSANWLERRAIVRAVVDYYGKDKNDLIIGILTYAVQDPQPAVRMEAVQSLSRIRAEQSLPLIKKTALEDRNDNVRWYAMKELRSFRDPSTAGIFIRGLESGDWLIREESVKGICSLDDAATAPGLVPYIIKAINDPRSSVMLTALRWVRTRDDRLYAVISEKLRNSSDYNYSLLQASLTALRGYDLDPKTNEKVIGLLVHSNPQIRVLALRVLKKERALESPE